MVGAVGAALDVVLVAGAPDVVPAVGAAALDVVLAAVAAEAPDAVANNYSYCKNIKTYPISTGYVFVISGIYVRDLRHCAYSSIR